MTTKTHEPENPQERETQAIQPAKHQPEPVIEPAPEISDELKRLSSKSDEPENEPDESPAEPKKTDIEACESAAAGMLITLLSVAKMLGHDFMIDENAVSDWAKDVAPAMAKYGLIPSVSGSKWGVELTALKATGMLGFGIYCGYRANKEKQINEPPKKEKAKAEVVTDGD